jgi:hypothetical protein
MPYAADLPEHLQFLGANALCPGFFPVVVGRREVANAVPACERNVAMSFLCPEGSDLFDRVHLTSRPDREGHPKGEPVTPIGGKLIPETKLTRGNRSKGSL